MQCRRITGESALAARFATRLSQGYDCDPHGLPRAKCPLGKSLPVGHVARTRTVHDLSLNTLYTECHHSLMLRHRFSSLCTSISKTFLVHFPETNDVRLTRHRHTVSVCLIAHLSIFSASLGLLLTSVWGLSRSALVS